MVKEKKKESVQAPRTMIIGVHVALHVDYISVKC